jgi:hypothetical protein
MVFLANISALLLVAAVVLYFVLDRSRYAREGPPLRIEGIRGALDDPQIVSLHQRLHCSSLLPAVLSCVNALHV